MLEQREFPIAPDKTHPIARAVIVLFPDIRTTGDFAKYQDEYVPFLAQRFRDVSGLLLARYKRQGYRIFGLVYQDTDDANFSYLYPQESFDELIVWNQSFRDLAKKKDEFRELYEGSFPQFTRALNLENLGEIVIGGYHAEDCVSNYAGYLYSSGYKTRIDLRLTDMLPFLLISHHLRKGMPRGMRDEHTEEDRRIWEHKKQA